MASVRKEHGWLLPPLAVAMHRVVLTVAMLGAVAPSAGSPDFW